MIKGLELSFLIAGIAAAFFAMNFYLMSLYDSQRKQPKKGWAWDYTLQLLTMAALVIVQPALWPGLAWSTTSPAGIASQILGGGLIAVSFGLHLWARRHLGKFYVERVEVQPDHQVIDTGPYTLVRHPIIASFLGLAGGLFLLNPGIMTGLVLIYTIWDFTGSARREEKLLSLEVPGYQEYMNRTPRFLPRLWRS